MTDPWRLSPQQQQVMDLTACGQATKQIAAQMRLSIKTVLIYRSIALEKMNCKGNAARAAVLWDRFAMGRDEAVDHSGAPA